MSNGILVVAEHLKGEISDVTYEMLGIGRELADNLKVPLCAVLLGDQVAALAKSLGAADTVFVGESAELALPTPQSMAACLERLVKEKGVSLVLVGGTNMSLGLSDFLGLRCQLPCVNFGKVVAVRDGTVVVTTLLFGGKIQSDVKLPDNRGIVSVWPGSFQGEAGKREGTPTIENLDVGLVETKVVFRKYLEPEAQDVDITKQNVLIGVGRGIQGQENLEGAEQLAQLLGGAVCASRPVIDQGWLPMSRQVGKSGMSVKPRFYLALGISGAPEHWEGMQGSQLIISVNTDEQAPIFDGSNYGACVDVVELLPLLVEKIGERKGTG